MTRTHGNVVNIEIVKHKKIVVPYTIVTTREQLSEQTDYHLQYKVLIKHVIGLCQTQNADFNGL